MEDSSSRERPRTPNLVVIAFILSLVSAFLLILGIILAVLVEEVGLVSFLSLVLATSLAAIICSLLARNSQKSRKQPGSRLAGFALVIGALVLFVTLLIRISVFFIFLPWLFA